MVYHVDSKSSMTYFTSRVRLSCGTCQVDRISSSLVRESSQTSVHITWEKHVLSAREFRRVGRHSEHAI